MLARAAEMSAFDNAAQDAAVVPGAEVQQRLAREHPQAFAWAVACCSGDRALAEDVLQTCYLKVLDGRARFAGKSSFRTWLFAVIRHTARDARRSFWRRRRLSLESVAEPATAAGSERRLDQADRLSRLAGALERLPRRQAQALSLVYGHGLTQREAAEVMDLSPGSVATHLHRGKQRLRKLVG